MEGQVVQIRTDVEAVTTTANNARTDLDNLNKDLTERIHGVEGNARTEKQKLEQYGVDLGSTIGSIGSGLVDLGNRVHDGQGSVGNATLLTRYKATIEACFKRRDEIIDAHAKTVGRLDPLHYASLTALPILFAFNVFFYSQIKAGKKMKPSECWSRGALVCLSMGAIIYFLYILLGKIDAIKERLSIFEAEFTILCHKFKGFSMTWEERRDAAQVRMTNDNNQTVLQVDEELVTSWVPAAVYDGLDPRQLITKFENQLFQESTAEKKISKHIYMS